MPHHEAMPGDTIIVQNQRRRVHSYTRSIQGATNSALQFQARIAKVLRQVGVCQDGNRSTAPTLCVSWDDLTDAT